MDRKFGYFIFGGMLVGALFGVIFGLPGIVVGALAGAFLGWFAAAIVDDQTKKQSKQ